MSNLIEQITAAFTDDQHRRGIKVLRRSELPQCYEDISPEWLTDVLCNAHDGAEVRACELSPPDNGSSNRRKIRVEYNAAGTQAGLPTALFCKASHDLGNRIMLGVAGAAHAEVTFYNEIRPLLNIEAPQPYFARLDEHNYNSIILLKDLSTTGTEFCSHKTEMTRARAESQIRLLAELHGKGYQDPRIKQQLARFISWPQFFQNTCAFGMREGSEQGFLAAEAVIPPQLYRRAAEIWPATVASVEHHNQLPHTLAHGDVHLKNWYVAAHGEMGLSDWQCTTHAYWARDFAYTISTALRIEDRRVWERELLRLYLDRLHAAGGPAIGFDDAWTHYRQQLMSSLTWWTVTLTPAPGMPDMQPRDITLEFIRRIATAIDDVDALSSFR